MKFGRGIFDLKREAYSFENAYLASQDNYRQKCLGLPQWGVPEWKRNFYSAECSQKNFLNEYSKRLNCVEVSSTYYADVSNETLLQWKKEVHSEFRFLPKWPKRISHDCGLQGNQVLIKNFVENIWSLEENLGVTFLQLPPDFSKEYSRELHSFLCQIPEDFPLAIEFRHSSWFEDGRLLPKLEKYLIDRNIGMVSSDTPDRRDVFHLSFTSNRNIIRYLSDENDHHDEKRLALWSEWLEGNCVGEGIYFIIHRPDNAFAPDLIRYFAPGTFRSIRDEQSGPQLSLF